MRQRIRVTFRLSLLLCIAILWMSGANSFADDDLDEIKKRGVLRHIGVPYANFVTGSGDGLDVEMVKLFAGYLGVKYQFVETSWKNVLGDLIGKRVRPVGDDAEVLSDCPIKGDIIASGLTVLAWREKVIAFSVPTFPNQVWLVARADSTMSPIVPTGLIAEDIGAVKRQLLGRRVLGVFDTCLDPRLYKLEESGALIKEFGGTLNELAPAVINGEAEATLLDVPDALIALEKWPGKIKVIGPISEFQTMAYAFRKASPNLKNAFNKFFEKSMRDGTYTRIVEKYYPTVFKFRPDFFESERR